MSGDGLPGPTDSWVTLAGLARETYDHPARHHGHLGDLPPPGPLAISVAQVDEMSGGRVDLGIGAGWFEAEHAGYAIPFPPLGERFERLAEQLDILTGLWTTPVGETFDYAGTHYTVTDSPALPKPVQRPHPPIVIGGLGAKRTPALAARYADEFNVPFQPVETRQGAIRPGVRGVAAGGPARRLDDLLGVLRGVRGPRRRRGRPARGRDRPGASTNCAATVRWSAPRPRSSTSWPHSRRPACSGCTCKCSIWPIWTI